MKALERSIAYSLAGVSQNVFARAVKWGLMRLTSSSDMRDSSQAPDFSSEWHGQPGSACLLMMVSSREVLGISWLRLVPTQGPDSNSKSGSRRSGDAGGARD